MQYTCSREGCYYSSDNIDEFVVGADDIICVNCAEKEQEAQEAKTPPESIELDEAGERVEKEEIHLSDDPGSAIPPTAQ